MKIVFNSLSRPKRAAKALVTLVPDLQLSKAQEAVAYICDYDSWEQLRNASESPASPPSVDDEDLAPEELEQRHQFQAERARAFFRVNPQQARLIVEAVAPGARMRSGKAPKPVVGTSVYMPPLGLVFEPNYPLLFEVLYDVAVLEVEFVQPSAGSPTVTQLVANMTVRFQSGKALELAGVDLWKFRDAVPASLAGKDGDYLPNNPYSEGSTADLAKRLRFAHDHLFAAGKTVAAVEDPPLRVDIDLAGGSVTTVAPPGLAHNTARALEKILASLGKSRVQEMQAAFDDLMRRHLAQGYMALEYRDRGAGMIGPEYVPKAWAGCEAMPFEKFTSQYTARQLNESGCGGNLSIREALTRDLLALTSVEQVAASWFGEIRKTDIEYYRQLCQDLGIGPKTAPRTLAALLLTTKDAYIIEFYMTWPILDAQKDKVLGQWVTRLSDRKPRPLARRERYGVAEERGGDNARA